jgi:hypothetical protein
MVEVTAQHVVGLVFKNLLVQRAATFSSAYGCTERRVVVQNDPRTTVFCAEVIAETPQFFVPGFLDIVVGNG